MPSFYKDQSFLTGLMVLNHFKNQVKMKDLHHLSLDLMFLLKTPLLRLLLLKTLEWDKEDPQVHFYSQLQTFKK